MPGNATTSSVMVSPATCVCDVSALGRFIRLMAGASHIGTLAAAIYGFKLASDYFDKTGSNILGVASFERLAYFTGFMALVFTIKSILGLLSEIRGPALLTTVLRPFGFLHHHRGRGCFMIYFGILFVFCPWDEKKKYVSFIPGGAQIVCGIALLLFRQFCPVFALASDGRIVLSSAAAPKAPSNDPRLIKWGESTNDADAPDEEAGSSASVPGSPNPPHAKPSKLFSKNSNVTKNPFLGN